MNDIKVIDVHAHVFPKSVMKRAVKNIGSYYSLPMRCDGSVETLITVGEKINTVKYVINNVATKPDQTESINDFIADLQKNDNKLIGFGTVHPKMKYIETEIERIISLGLQGLKLHPEFQNFNIDDEALLPVYERAQGSLPVLIHLGDENVTSSSPDRLAKILKLFPNLKVIASHLGGYTMWDESIEHLSGKNVWFDTSSSLAFLSKQDAVRIIRSHGTDRVMFGTDYPMWLPEQELELFLSLGLSDEENEKILYKNAAEFFNL